MTQGPVPQEVASFIQRNIDSIADLEALLILRERSGAPWGTSEIAARLYVSERYAQEVMERLRARNLIVPAEGGYRYVARPELEPVIGGLAEYYATHLIPVTNLIHAKSTDRIRQFAEAFKFKKDKDS